MRHQQGRRNGTWTDAAILRESERWVHVPPSGVRVEDAGRLLVHLPAPRGASRVWRSRPGRTEAEALILQTIEEARAAGGTRLVWHTGDAVSPPFMDDLLPEHGFEKTEDLDVLAFELGTEAEPELPKLRVPAGVPITTWDERDTCAYLRGILELEGRRRKRTGPDYLLLVLRYLASVRGTEGDGREIVATAGAEVAGETVRLWGAGTLAGHRGRGAYRALVMERCRHAHALGATLALAKANTASSAPILRTADFRPVARERRYALEMAAPARPRG